MTENNRGKVLYIGGFELPDRNAAAHRVIANAKILESIGYEVVFIGVDKTLDTSISLLNTRREYGDFVYYSIPYPKNLYQWFKYLSDISYIKRVPDFLPTHIIAYNFPSLGLKKLIRHGRKNNIKILGDCTEWYQASGNIIQKIIKEADVYWRMKILHFELDGLIVISDYLENYYKTKVKNIINIPPLVDLSLPKWPDTWLNNSEKRKLTIVYAGSPGMGNKDRIDWIINALRELKKNTRKVIDFKVIGITKEQYYQIFPLEVSSDKSEDFIRFFGRIDHLEVLKELNISDFQLFLRENNRVNNAGFPTKFGESISCGTPVLTNSTSNISKFLIERKNGLLLDIETEESLYSSIFSAVNLSFDDIDEMKKFCLESKLFDFQNYVNDMNLFCNKL